MENESVQPTAAPSTSKKRQKHKHPKEPRQMDADTSADEDQIDRPKSSKKRKISKSIKRLSDEIQDEMQCKPKLPKMTHKLEEMLKEAEENEAKAKEAEILETEDDRTESEILMRAPWKVDIHAYNDLVSLVTDEISLEGLDGITLEALWLRLATVMSLNVPQTCRNIIWTIIINCDKLDFYQLPEPRGKLVIFNRFEHVDVLSGYLVDIDELPEDVYPFSPLSEEQAAHLNIYGSCANFNIRELVTNKIRNLKLSEAESIGNKLVIVANQSLRNECLGLNETKSLTKLYNQQYSLLERIGRSRKLGEASAGKTSLRSFADSKIMFYLRKVLIRNDLITKQPVYFKNKKGGSPTSGLLFHLKRFHFHYKMKKVLLIEQIVDMLKKKPDLRMEYVELKRAFGSDMWNNAVVKMLKGSELKQFVNTNIIVPYRDIYPNAPKEEWMGKNKKQKNLRVIQLIDPTVNVANFLKESTKEELQKDESSDDEPLCEGAFNKSAYHQIYNVIYESGTEGLTQSQISLKLGVDVYQTRIVMKSLEKDNFIYSTNADLGCYRVMRYFATCAPKQAPTLGIENPQRETIIEEEADDETIDFISNILEIDKEHLKVSNVDIECEKSSDDNNLKGEYAFIKEYREKCRRDKYNTRFRGEFYKIENLEDGKRRMEKILSNEHGYFSMQDSIKNGVIKKIDLGIDFDKNIYFEKEDVEAFDLFSENYKVAKSKQIIDYNCMQLQVKNFFRKTSTFFVEKEQNVASIAILINYLLTYSDISMDVLFEKFHMVNQLFAEQKASRVIEYPKELNESDNEDNLETFDKISLAENFENEEFVAEDISEDIKQFKSDLISNFENETPEIGKIFLEAQTPLVYQDVQEVEIFNDYKKELSLEQIFGDGVKEIDRNYFNTLIDDFQVEDFFGEAILVEYTTLDKDQIETIVIFSKNQNVNIDIGTKYVNKNLSQRALQRANYILDILYKEKVISDIPKVVNNLKKYEFEKGLVGAIDRKSLNRLLQKLISEGYLMAIRVVLRHKKSVRTKNIIALTKSDYQPILNAIKEQMKMSFFIYTRRKNVKHEKYETNENISSAKIQEMEVDIYGSPKYRSNKTIGKCYGYLPKNSRHRVLHEFLFYLVYGYDGSLIEKSDLPSYIKQGNFQEYPLYQKEISWKMFIPPLSEYKNYPRGWILYCDALLRMPICIFVKIYNVVYVIPELVQILNDPIKKYLLLQNIPPKIRNACFFKRKYIFSIYEGLQHLCYQGLLQFGELSIRTKDQQFVYLNRKAIIYDTISSNPGYHQISEKEYPKLSFEFLTKDDVDYYWNKVWNICLKTRLGVRYSLLNQTITLQNIHAIPQMIEATQPRSREEAVQNDVGYLPGDGKGACGFDSNSWMFVKRNWVRSTVFKEGDKFGVSSSRPIGVRKKQLDKVKVKAIKMKDLQKEVLKKKKKRTRLGIETNSNVQKVEQLAQTVGKSKRGSKNKVFTRKIHPRPHTRKIKRIDELDKSIKKSGLFTRSKFGQNEDNMLITISYAIRYLCPGYKKRLIAFTVIRDMMHRLCPKNLKKTSTAYNTRLRKFYKFTSKPDIDANAVSLDADHFVQKHFSKFRDKILTAKTIPQDHLHIALIYLVAYCVDSFEKNSSTNKKILDEVGYVDYLEDGSFNENVKPEVKNSLYQDPTSKEEILIDTAKSVIHSSIGFETDNTIKVLRDHLDSVYQIFSEDVLRKSFLNLREHNLIKTPFIHGRKVKKPGKPETILQSSYMYSYKQVTKFHEKIYIEAYSLLNALKNSKTTNRFNPNEYQEGFGLGFSELQTIGRLDIIIQIPDKQFILDPNIQNHDSLMRELNTRYKRLMSKRASDQEILTEGKDNQEKSETTDKDDNTLNDLEELSTCIKNRDYTKINTKMSDLAFLLTKGLFPELEDEDDKLERLSRHFLTMVPDISFKVDDFETTGLVEEFRDGGLERIKDVIYRDCIFRDFEMSAKEIEESLKGISGNSCDVEAAMQLLEFVKGKDILGATAGELKDNFLNSYGILTLGIVMEHFMKIGAIFRSGVKTFRFVYHEFKSIWMVDCQRDEDTIPIVKLIPMPWLKVNGKVNDKVLLNWLFVIQSYCISNPLASFPSVCKRFNFLKPVNIYALLEYLQVLGCLKLKCYERCEEVTLFSEPSYVGAQKSSFLDDLDNVYVETRNLAVTKLGILASIEQVLMNPFGN